MTLSLQPTPRLKNHFRSKGFAALVVGASLAWESSFASETKIAWREPRDCGRGAALCENRLNAACVIANLQFAAPAKAIFAYCVPRTIVRENQGISFITN